MVSSTVEFYNNNSYEFYNNTISAEMDSLYKSFLEYVVPGGKILDAGCGSGRDSLYFKNQGFSVTAFDASEEMVKLSSRLIKQEVLLMRFEELKLDEQYDGIWACASLLHVRRQDSVNVIRNLAKFLKGTGVFYMSFKYGDKEYEKDGRYFNCFDEENFKAVILQIPELSIEKINITIDVRPGRNEEYWLNCYLIKK